MKHNQVRQVVFPIITAMIWGPPSLPKAPAPSTGAYTFNAARSLRGLFGLAGGGTNL